MGIALVDDFQQSLGELDVSVLVVLELLELRAVILAPGLGQVGVDLRSLALLVQQCKKLFAQHRLLKHRRPLSWPGLPTAPPIADVARSHF